MKHTADPTPFPCLQCGECCRHIDRIPQLAQFDGGDGVCIHLKGNLCEIYADRPDICSVDRMYALYFHQFYTREKFYQLNLQGCKKVLEEFRPELAELL